MEFVNFYVSIPLIAYLKLENQAKNSGITKNEFIVHAILGHLSSDGAALRPQKNAGISNMYN